MSDNENEVFTQKPLITRTPQRHSDNIQMTPTNLGNNSGRNMNKRGLQNTTLDDLFNLIEKKSEIQNKKLDNLNSNMSIEIANLKTELKENFDTSLKKIDKKIDLVEMKADQGLRMATENRKLCINFMKQSRLDCCMDISGLKFEEKTNDLKKLAYETIKSFKINVEEMDIKKVSSVLIKKPNSNTNKLLTVTFEDMDTKIRILREKTKIKDARGIFFSPTLTPENGYFMRKAKYITKGTNIKPSFHDGAVHVKINEKNVMIINDEENLNELKNYIDQQAADVIQSNTSSSNVTSQ